jgi:transposase
MIGLFRPTKAQREDHHRSLPVAMRQLMVDLKVEYADFTDGEIAAICAIQFAGRRPSHHTVKAVFADGPPPWRASRQFPSYEEIGTPEERRQAVMRVHAQGWSISPIARYLDVSRPTIYEILTRWVEEGVQGLPDKSHAKTSKPGVDLPTRNIIRKKQEENPLLGEFRNCLHKCCAKAARHFRVPTNLWADHGRESSALRDQTEASSIQGNCSP